MALCADELLRHPPIMTRQFLTQRDTILYALGVGAEELQFVYESGLLALPTLLGVLATPGFIWRDPKYGVNWRRILHGEQSLELFAPAPIEGEFFGETRIEALVDKGAEKGAICYLSREIRDASGVHIATVRSATFLRGDGGFGGPSHGGPTRNRPAPKRAPEHVATLATWPHQAMIYRLSGDYNPLHIDPCVAKVAGFDRPILHGMCTYGVVGRALLSTLCGNDPSRMKRMDARFSAPVYPGETIITEIWRHDETSAAFRASVAERQLVVLNHGYVEFK